MNLNWVTIDNVDYNVSTPMGVFYITYLENRYPDDKYKIELEDVLCVRFETLDECKQWIIDYLKRKYLEFKMFFNDEN